MAGEPFDFEVDPFADDSLPAVSISTGPYELTDDEKKKALDAWNSGKSKLKDIIVASVGPNYDGRSRQGLAVKSYLASLKISPTPAQEYQRKTDDMELTEAHKEYIRNHAATNTALALAREIYNDPSLQHLSAKARVVNTFYNSLDPSLRMKSNVVENPDYNPPRSVEQTVYRINKYVLDAIDPKNLSEKNKACITALTRYMHVHQYLFSIREYTDKTERELFESAYVRFCYDKPDLSEEEITLYLNLCSDIVNLKRLQKDLTGLIAVRDEVLDETKKMPMPIVEAIGKTYKEIDDNQKRQKVISDTLSGKRSERMAKRKQETASVLQLVEMWKNEEHRLQLIKLAEARKNKIKDEVQRLETMEDLRFQLWGIGKEELLNY
jgi:hypothetical protein